MKNNKQYYKRLGFVSLLLAGLFQMVTNVLGVISYLSGAELINGMDGDPLFTMVALLSATLFYVFLVLFALFFIRAGIVPKWLRRLFYLQWIAGTGALGIAWIGVFVMFLG